YSARANLPSVPGVNRAAMLPSSPSCLCQTMPSLAQLMGDAGPSWDSLGLVSSAWPVCDPALRRAGIAVHGNLEYTLRLLRQNHCSSGRDARLMRFDAVRRDRWLPVLMASKDASTMF